jgi:hypothetical protein
VDGLAFEETGFVWCNDRLQSSCLARLAQSRGTAGPDEFRLIISTFPGEHSGSFRLRQINECTITRLALPQDLAGRVRLRRSSAWLVAPRNLFNAGAMRAVLFTIATSKLGRRDDTCIGVGRLGRSSLALRR